LDLTAQIPHPHPSLSGFITTIKFFDRAATIRKQSQIIRSRKPEVVRNADGTPFIWNGEPLLAWKANLPEDYAFTSAAEYITSWSGLVLDGAEIPYAPENLRFLFDERLDAEVERTVENQKKTVKVSWAEFLSDKAYDRKTFDPDPKTNGSAKQ